jgi:hypothetical protein
MQQQLPYPAFAMPISYLLHHCLCNRPTQAEPKGDLLGRNAAAAAAANAKAAKKNAKRSLAKQRKAEEAVTGPAGGSSSIAGSTSGQLATGVCCQYCCTCCLRDQERALVVFDKTRRKIVSFGSNTAEIKKAAQSRGGCHRAFWQQQHCWQ